MSIEEILKELNEEFGADKEKWEWREAAGTHALSVINFKDEKIEVDTGHVMIVKAFINNRTGEVKSFLAKTIKDFSTKAVLKL